MSNEPARIIAILLAVVTSALTAWQANTDQWSTEQLGAVLAALAGLAAIGTYLTTNKFGPAIIPAVVGALQAIVALLVAFGIDTGETPLGVIIAVLAAIGGEVNRSQRTPALAG